MVPPRPPLRDRGLYYLLLRPIDEHWRQWVERDFRSGRWYWRRVLLIVITAAAILLGLSALSIGEPTGAAVFALIAVAFSAVAYVTPPLRRFVEQHGLARHQRNWSQHGQRSG